jgi:hypothetical protein
MKSNATLRDATVGIFKTHNEAENAVKELQKLGFKMNQLSIIGKGFHTEEHVVGYYNTGDRVKLWGKTGAFWGSIWGLLFGSAFFWIPGVGPLAVGGPLVAAIVGGLEGAAVVGGMSALTAGLFSIGIPKDSLLSYQVAIEAGQFVLIIHGNAHEAESARKILKGHSSLKRVETFSNRAVS